MSKTDPSPIKLTSKLSVLFAVISEHTSLFLIPTIIAYLVEFVSDDKSFDSVSFYVGLQEGLFRISGTVGALVWASLSDKIGRKNSLAITMSGVALSSLGQGLCTSINVLIFWRVFAGFFSATIPILKALISDMSDDSNISQFYSFFASGYGFASIFGPLIGGFCSRPYLSLPLVFDYDFFHQYPYFLPFFIHALISCFALVFILVFIPGKSRESVGMDGKGNGQGLWRNRKYRHITAVFFLHAWIQFSYRTLVSLWVKSDKSLGGIGWDEERNPGIMCCLSGFIVASIPLILNKRLSKSFGVGRSIIIVEGLLIPLLILMSFNNNFQGLSLWIALIFSHGFILCCITISTSFISIGISNALGDSSAGTAFGISQGIVSLARSFSAAGSAELFRRNVKNYFPFDSHLVFFIDSFLCVIVICYILTFIGQSLDVKGIANQTDDGQLEYEQKPIKDQNSNS